MVTPSYKLSCRFSGSTIAELEFDEADVDDLQVDRLMLPRLKSRETAGDESPGFFTVSADALTPTERLCKIKQMPDREEAPSVLRLVQSNDRGVLHVQEFHAVYNMPRGRQVRAFIRADHTVAQIREMHDVAKSMVIVNGKVLSAPREKAGECGLRCDSPNIVHLLPA